MVLILVKNKEMNFPCIAQLTTQGNKLMQVPGRVKTMGVNYFHYYLVGVGNIKVGDWVLNIHSKYGHKEICQIDNSIELERYGKDKAKIYFSSDFNLGLPLCEDIESYFNLDNELYNQLRNLGFKESDNSFSLLQNYQSFIYDKNSKELVIFNVGEDLPCKEFKENIINNLNSYLKPPTLFSKLQEIKEGDIQKMWNDTQEYDNINSPTILTKENLAGINSFDQLLNLRYGKVGTELRDEFEKKVNNLIKEDNKLSLKNFHNLLSTKGNKLSKRRSRWLKLIENNKLTCIFSQEKVSYARLDYDSMNKSHHWNLYNEKGEMFIIKKSLGNIPILEKFDNLVNGIEKGKADKTLIPQVNSTSSIREVILNKILTLLLWEQRAGLCNVELSNLQLRLHEYFKKIFGIIRFQQNKNNDNN